MSNLTAKQIWGKLENGRHYKSTENIYNITARNERMIAGDQWYGVSVKLPKTTYNFLEQQVNVKVSTLMADQLTIHRKPDDLSEDDDRPTMAAQAFTEQDKRNWERNKMDMLNEQMLLKAATGGLGGTFWYWDDDIVTGNSHIVKGDFKGETVDAISLYVANPNEIDIQKQDWIIISSRHTVERVRQMAIDNGMSEEEAKQIKGDETKTYEAYDKAQQEQDKTKESNQITVLLYMYKDKKTKKVHAVKSTATMILKEDFDTELERYPVAIMNWKTREKFIYGESEVTYIVANQMNVNKLEAMRTLQAQLFVPKGLFNKNMVSGISSKVGGMYPVNVPAGSNLDNALVYKQPKPMTIDVDKAIDSGINLTQRLAGVNDNVLGAARPENTSAIIAQQRAAGVPLESIKRRFKQYIEDVALIWLDFYKNKYKLVRKLKDDEGTTHEFTGTELADVYLQTKIDVGASSQWSELLTTQVLDNLLAQQVITPLQYVERYPKNIIPDQDKLIEQMGGGEESEVHEAGKVLMAQFLGMQPPEVQQQILQLPPDEQEKEIANMILSQMPQGEM